MSQRREIRRLAMQLLYQIDLRGEEDCDSIRQSMGEAPGDELEHQAAFELAVAAWNNRHLADTLCTELAPDWPTHRQPPVDRAIIRLAYHEVLAGHAPARVAINEAVDLAKKFGAENSPAFINGVLDKMIKRSTSGGSSTTPEITASDSAPGSAGGSSDADPTAEAPLPPPIVAAGGHISRIVGGSVE
ncbi:MAG: transcription antitermination factor NusB [Phycisphaeraceae bacterium]|nr:transcription antitermination factor NusB [Phycisphaeraceae bacterium]